MADLIVVHSSPGNGKTTISSKLHEFYKTPWFEFGWIPEFRNLNPHTEISYMDEEKMTFESLVLVAKNYIRHGFGNVILSDLNDRRMIDIANEFKDYRFVIVTLYSEDDEIIKSRILERNNGNTYKNFEESIEINRKIKQRKLLPNEYRIRTDNHSDDEVAEQVKQIIAGHIPVNEYDLIQYNSDDYFSYTD